MAPAWKDESGWTLPELLVGLFLSLGIAASSLIVLQTTMHSQIETGTRLTAQDNGTTAMLRMTKDIRTATAATVQTSTILDLQVPQRNPSGGAPLSVHVRYACTGAPQGTCTRSVCNTPFSSNSCSSPTNVVAVATGVFNTDNFQGVSMGVAQPWGAPATTPSTWAGTGTAGPSNVGFISLHLRIVRTTNRWDGATVTLSDRPLDFHDGADLENYSN